MSGSPRAGLAHRYPDPPHESVAMRPFLCVAAILLGVALAVRQDRPDPIAGTALRLDLDELVTAADLVLEARVVSATPVEAPDGMVHTDYQLAVDRTFWGLDQPVRTVRLPGGVLPSGRGTMIPGMPELRAGEDLILMLSEPSHLGSRVVIGLSQGRWLVVADGRGRKFALRPQGGATLLSGPGGVPVEDHGIDVLEYADLLARLEAAVAAKRARGIEEGGQK